MIVVEGDALAAPLRPFVSRLWATDGGAAGVGERVLPTGAMHLVVRLSDAPVRVFAGDGAGAAMALGRAVIGGARSTFYRREAPAGGRSVGAQLRCGASAALFAMPASELASRHTALDDVWGTAAAAAVDERLVEAPSAAAALALFQRLLVARLSTPLSAPGSATSATRSRGSGADPAIARAVAALAAGGRVDASVRASGWSHRHFVARFRADVGLTPKTYARVVRFQRATVRLAMAPAGDIETIATIAADCGYSDQSHLDRDFRAFAGLAPDAYRALGPVAPNHVPLDRDSGAARGQIRPRRERVLRRCSALTVD